MRRFICCLLLPAVVIVGLVAIKADTAEAGWRRHRRAPARVVVVTQPAPVIVAQPAPVIVSPRPYYYRHYSPYWRSGVDVYAPGVRVQVGRRVRVGW